MFASHQRKLILVRTDPIQDLVQEPSDFKTSIEAASSNEIVLIEDRRAKDSFQNLSNFSKFMEDYDWNDSRLLVSTPINDVLLRETCWLYMYHNSKDYANDPSIIHLRRLVMSITDNKHEFNSAIFHAPQEQNTIDSYSNTLGSLIFFHINVNVEELHDAILQKVQDLNDALATRMDETIQDCIHSLLLSIIKMHFTSQIERKEFSVYQFLVFFSLKEELGSFKTAKEISPIISAIQYAFRLFVIKELKDNVATQVDIDGLLFFITDRKNTSFGCIREIAKLCRTIIESETDSFPQVVPGVNADKTLDFSSGIINGVSISINDISNAVQNLRKSIKSKLKDIQLGMPYRKLYKNTIIDIITQTDPGYSFLDSNAHLNDAKSCLVDFIQADMNLSSQFRTGNG